MRYLPSKTISESFCAQLLPRIVARLQVESILLSRSEKQWKRPSQLKWLTQDGLDETGEPLFDNLATELYLSRGYRLIDKPGLDVLDVKDVNMAETLDRVMADLSKPSSKMKSPSTSMSWHSRSAELLRLLFKKNWFIKATVSDLALIPVRNGEWVSGAVGSDFSPENNRVPVPTDLGLWLVQPSTLEVAARKALIHRPRRQELRAGGRHKTHRSQV